MDLLTAILYGFTGIFGFLVVVIIYYSFNWNKKHFWVDKNVPFEEPEAFVPALFKWLLGKKMYWETDREWCQKHGRVFGCYQAFLHSLYITDSDLIRRIMVKDFHMLPDRRPFDFLDPIANSIVVRLTGDDWKRVRSVITPAFSTGKLKRTVGLMGDCAQMIVENLTKMADETDGTVECKKTFGGFTMDVIANIAFGIKLNSAKDPDNIFIKNAKEIFNLTFPWRFILAFAMPRLSGLLGISVFEPSVKKFFVDLTDSVMKKRKETKVDRGDFLQSLIEAQTKGEVAADHSWSEGAPIEETDTPSEECQSFLKKYSNKTLSKNEFVATCLVFFMAGFDTTATTLSMTVYFLALNRECQKKVIEEVDEVAKSHPEFSYEVLNKLKYIDAAISETLRLVPPLPRIERKALVDYHIPEVDFTVPKDFMVTVPVYALHRDPEFFPDPDRYEPERFLPENRENIRPYTYIPFGTGPRNCIGMRFALLEMKVCLYNIFREVTFETCPQTQIPPDVFAGAGLYQPKAVHLKVVKRIKT